MYAARTDRPIFAGQTPWRQTSRVALPIWRWRWHVLGVVAVALLATGYARLAIDGRAESGSSEIVTVAPGDTLWAIAARRYPGADPREKVPEIERLNALNGPMIAPGQRLRLPGAR